MKQMEHTKVFSDLVITAEDDSIKELVNDLVNKLVISRGNKTRSEIISSIKPHVSEESFKNCFKSFKQRSFKLIVLSLKAIKGIDSASLNELFQGDEYYGRYLGSSPNQAGKKAFTQIHRKLKKKRKIETVEIEFTLKETTNDSEKKEYSYRGMTYEQPRYMIIKKDNSGKRKIEYIPNDEGIECEIRNGKQFYKRNEDEEISKIQYKTKVVSLKNIIK
jgi:hypothetical protein